MPRLSYPAGERAPWLAKLSLGSFRMVDAAMTVSFWARALPEGGKGDGAGLPAVSVDVVHGASWLGHWQVFNPIPNPYPNPNFNSWLGHWQVFNVSQARWQRL